MAVVAPCAIAGSTPATVSFNNDVMAVLSRAGCNAGACHGNKNGKGGFKLSLRGQDPEADYESLTRDLYARRVNLLAPDESLILLKPLTKIAHQGGKRFTEQSPEFQLLRRWIAEGAKRDDASVPALVKLEVTPTRQVLVAPADRVKVTATAVFSDNTRRDVSNLCVYEQSVDLAKVSPDGVVQRQRMGEEALVVRYLQAQQVVRLAFVPARPDFAWNAPAENNYIDHEVFATLKSLRMTPSGDCTDHEFVRRAYLDLLGILPTADEAKAYVEDKSSDKRSRLIDQLLDRPEYADFWALKWSDLLRNEERTIDRKGVQAFHFWIRQSVAENKPLDRFVRELVSAHGSTYKNPPANYYRANRDAVTRGEATAELFLGVRLQCARCHNHPFDRWTQDDYYDWADVFARVDYRIIENRRTDKNDSHEFIGEQIVYEKKSGDVEDPRPGHKPVPKLLGLSQDVTSGEDRLDAVAEWITSPKNPFFARTQVNRIWFDLMGRGIVDPIDDFRATNPPSHPELLDRLAKDFVAHHYDVRYMIKLIMSSRVYALSPEPNATNADDETNYSHVIPRRLTAEQLLDSQHEVMQVPAEFAGYPKGIRAAQISGVRAVSTRTGGRPTLADQFLITFGKPPRLLVCECERSSDTTLGQAFQLISGPETEQMLSADDNRLARAIKAGQSDEQIIDDLYWSALSRGPSAQEMRRLIEHVNSAKNRRAGLEDIAW
ncbi:MAG TPA: DUF1549 and DUF1553 domain-containing protein, partial [Tepidisphaeraceae bacterium]|nr:DUF1549 and DUF1553 domain-containing protein [Tepidisphaeraceae bacterium]